MPAPITYSTKRGKILFTPSHPTSAETEQVRPPTPPYRPRTRRPHSICIIRLPTPNTNSHKKRQNKCNDLRKITSCKTVKGIFTSVLAPFTSKSSAQTYSIAPSSSYGSESSQEIGSALTGLAVAAISTEGSYTRKSRKARDHPILSGNNMSRYSTGDNHWTPTFSTDIPTSRNSECLISPRNGLMGTPGPLGTHRSIYDLEKPLATGNGVSCSIILAEPVIFLMGLDNDGTTRDSNGANATALLRGTVRLNVAKNAKIKAISLKFTGRAKTLWPEGIPPNKQETVEETSLRTQVIPFFNALHKGSDSSYGDLCTHTLRNSKTTELSVTNLSLESSSYSQQSSFSLSGITNRAARHSSIAQTSEARRLSVPSSHLKTYQKGDSIYNIAHSKGYKIFYPGVYDYSFELPIDNNMPETTNLPLASVKWELEATVERAGTFKANLVGRREVSVVRSPSQDSLELVEPIAVSRTWDQQLHYDIVISGKTFPIGTKIPIAFKLTPLAKVQVHKVKIYLTENIDYFARGKSVQRKDIKRRMLLFEKCAGKPIAKEFRPSEIKITGGECSVEERDKRRSFAMRRREAEAQRSNTQAVSLPIYAENLLGDIDLGVEEWCGPTEIEMNVQLPTCDTMEKDRSKRLAHDCTWKNVHVHHWLKILIRLSRSDADDPTKRRHYEISVDSPISLLNCRASLANISLPEYSGLTPDTQGAQQVCGCANAVQAIGPTTMQTILNESSSTSHPLGQDTISPVRAHESVDMAQGDRRPMHLLRSPSFQPPPFDAEEPPPPIATPPPLYDNVIGTPSHDGLADYFVRLGEYEGEVTDDEYSINTVDHSLVEVASPHSPRANLNRTMDINHNFLFGTNTVNNGLVTGKQSNVSAP